MRTLALTLATALLLVGCGSEDADDGAATDPGTTETATPTEEPAVGSYPSFEPEDYTYTLHVQCFCLHAEDGVRVTVEDGEVVDAVYGDPKPGADAAQVEAFRRLTINDVIDAANDIGAANVEVRWPAGQDYPSSVWVDHSKRIADEEIGYTVSDVDVG